MCRCCSDVSSSRRVRGAGLLRTSKEQSGRVAHVTEFERGCLFWAFAQDAELRELFEADLGEIICAYLPCWVRPCEMTAP